MYIIDPSKNAIVILSTFITPVSHHDPAVHDKSNRSMFLRRKQMVQGSVSSLPSSDYIDNLVAQFPAPAPLAPLFDNLSLPEYLAIVLLREFANSHPAGGLYDGKERYRRLEERARHQAIRATNIFGWWGALAQDLQVGLAAFGSEDRQLALLTMHPALAQLVFAQLQQNSTSAMRLAQIWAGYAEDTELVPMRFAPIEFNTAPEIELEVPAVSANSIRHEMVREPGMWHLLNTLGLQLNELDPGVAAMLYNGGDLNSAEPSHAFASAGKLREAYPLLSLLGGSTSGFVIGESNLGMSAWLVCRENQYALDRYEVVAQHSAFDMLDIPEHTRHANKRVEVSPMPFSFETLIQGAQILIELHLRPYTTQLEIGALTAALQTYIDADSTLFGQSARGYGLANHEFLRMPDFDTERLRLDYEAYLEAEKMFLAEGLRDGTLTTGKKLF